MFTEDIDTSKENNLWIYWDGPVGKTLKRMLETAKKHNKDALIINKEIAMNLGAKEVFDLTENHPKWVQSDVLRLWLLKKFGGCWADADAIHLKPFDLYDELGGQIEFVGMYDHIKKQPVFCNSMIASYKDGGIVNMAYDKACSVVQNSVGKVPWAKTGQYTLAPLWRQNKSVMRRVPRTKYMHIAWYQRHRFFSRGLFMKHELGKNFYPNAVCYHTTGKIIRQADQILRPNHFLSFLFNKANGNVKPPRSAEILKRVPNTNCVGVEVGVSVAINSRQLSQQRPNLFLHLVDPWLGDYEDYVNSGDRLSEKSQEVFDKRYHITINRMKFAEDRVQIHRETSVDASESFGDESVDFVFIDANHSYEFIKEDITSWWPKIKRGGFISGHDYNHPKYPQWGVTKAVEEFVFTHNLSLETGKDHTWFVRKEK